ncbi:MAG: TrmH family RNA methyltransferase [Alphaproteobacteria bacterium]
MSVYKKTGFFAVGAEGISKERNAGAIFRTAHAFDADFVFTVNPEVNIKTMYQADTSKTFQHLPYYEYESADEINVPKNCAIVGVELCDKSVELPEFCHPMRAAYVFGPERGSLSSEMQEKCDYIVKIPTKFCINVSAAAAIIIYDRVQSLHKWRRRPLTPRGKLEEHPPHQSGGPIIRKNRKKDVGYDF